jgi:type IV pilus biogenesis protein PilP
MPADARGGSAPALQRVRAALLAGLAGAAAWASAQVPANSPPATPAATIAAAPVATAPAALPATDNADQLGQAAAMIARLRQQQAVVEAQAGLAKATAELARVQQATPGPAVPLSLPAASLAGKAGAADLESMMTAPRRGMRLLGVTGSPQQRVATLEMGDGSVRSVRAGAVVGAWSVQSVHLTEVVLLPRARSGTQLTLLDDGSMREAPYTAPAQATAVRKRQP